MVGGRWCTIVAASCFLSSSTSLFSCDGRPANRPMHRARSVPRRCLFSVCCEAKPRTSSQSATSYRTLDSAMVSDLIEPCIVQRNEVAVTRIGSACLLGETSAVALLLPVSVDRFRASACPSAPLMHANGAFPSGHGQRGVAWRGVVWRFKLRMEAAHACAWMEL